MSEIEQTIANIFSNPEELSKLTNMAKSLMDGGLFAPDVNEKPQDSKPEEGGFDPLLQKMLGGFTQQSPSGSTAKLSAICPYLDESHSRKLERAIKMAKMAKIARMVMRDYGGEEDGDK